MEILSMSDVDRLICHFRVTGNLVPSKMDEMMIFRSVPTVPSKK
jgi:hypothetical protein